MYRYLHLLTYMSILILLDIEERKNKRNAEMEHAGSKIFNLVEECRQFFKAEENSDIWKAYLEYIDELVIDGLNKTMAASIGYLLDETDSTLTQGALFEIRLELSEPDVIFVPPLDKNLVGNFYDIVNGYLDDIFNGCTLIPRVAKHLDKNFDINAKV